MFSTARSALPLTAVKESCSCCSTPSRPVEIAAAGRLQVDADATLAPGAHPESDA